MKVLLLSLLFTFSQSFGHLISKHEITNVSQKTSINSTLEANTITDYIPEESELAETMMSGDYRTLVVIDYAVPGGGANIFGGPQGSSGSSVAVNGSGRKVFGYNNTPSNVNVAYALQPFGANGSFTVQAIHYKRSYSGIFSVYNVCDSESANHNNVPQNLPVGGGFNLVCGPTSSNF